MPRAAKLAAEADKASLAFEVALAEIGAKTIEDAISMWSDVPVNRVDAVSAKWLDRAVRLVLFRRGQSRALSMAYYRLVRALRTGTTIADPDHPEPKYITLQELRDEFAALASDRGTTVVDKETGEITGAKAPEPPTAPESTPSPTTDPPAELSDADLDRILVEELEGLEAALAEQDARAETEAEVFLDLTGPRNLNDKLTIIDTSQPGDVVDEERQTAHDKAGNAQAASAEHSVMDGARGTIWATSQLDKRVIGFIRLSRTGTPCGWCAMLISRGPVYKSAEGTSASTTYGDLDKYHDHCHCYAEPIFSLDQYNSDPRYDLNRQYADLWPQITRGYSGKAAITVWRRFIREQQKLAQAASTP